MDANFATSFGQYSFDSWYNFVFFKRFLRIEGYFMKWMIALWTQILIFFVILIVGYFKLHKQSKDAHKEVFSNCSKRRVSKKNKDSTNGLYIPGLHDAISSYNEYLFRQSKEVSDQFYLQYVQI